MGKWTTECYDDVLGIKMKSLVSGAIQRAKLEKVEPMISYETFVEDLDRGDSFTTSLIEVLVKEVAERGCRPNSADRGLIGDRTARSLRRLSSPASVYRERAPGRGTGGRRGVDLAEYLSQPPDELDMDEDDDELGPYSAFVPVVEGTRLNTDLYEAYRSQHTPPGADSMSDRVLPPLVDASPPARSGNVWPLPPTSGFLHSTLSRQPSLRRPARNRASDFSEFTAARRSSTRQIAQDEDPPLRPDPSMPTPTEMPSSSSLRSSSDDHPAPRNPVQARRFFPFGRARRFEIIPTPRPATSPSDDWFFPPHSGWSERPGGAQGDEESNDERSQAPRLRRGGLRAPESMISPPLTPHELHVNTGAIAAPITTAATTEGRGESTPPAEPSTTLRSVPEEFVQSSGEP
ncbi:hypothetical protein PAXINDRAFT_100737 [Paxillus involutus ATCC 200175]|uniref:Uncharacterized protein n=1 Tax=Paxillus involutus ATCC 200175 TaxID=664439 RepID=A0A0C9SVC6_PAXIN|nr:hypothetical protein PAXINDRAFT_100737 [Paxillus involutus ATCC 200175]